MIVWRLLLKTGAKVYRAFSTFRGRFEAMIVWRLLLKAGAKVYRAFSTFRGRLEAMIVWMNYFDIIAHGGSDISRNFVNISQNFKLHGSAIHFITCTYSRGSGFFGFLISNN
jgi:uncharacterized membrane protein